MDPTVVTVAATAATTLVAAMTTDAWERAKHSFARWVGLGRDEDGTGAEEELEQARAEVLVARERRDARAERMIRDRLAEQLAAALEGNAHQAAEWEHTLHDLRAEYPEITQELSALSARIRQPDTTYIQTVGAGGAGAQGPGASATVNHNYAPGSHISHPPQGSGAGGEAS